MIPAGASVGGAMILMEKRWNIDIMYYDGHSEVGFAASFTITPAQVS